MGTSGEKGTTDYLVIHKEQYSQKRKFRYDRCLHMCVGIYENEKYLVM